MIKLVCKNQLLHKTINNYLTQKNVILSTESQKHQIVINIHDNDKLIKIDINNNKIEIPLPIDINVLDYIFSRKLLI